MKVVFLGDSHTWPLVQGIKSTNPPFEVKAQPLGSQRHLCEPFFALGDKSIKITAPDATKFVQSLPLLGYENAPYVVSMGFHTAHFTWIAKKFSHLDCLGEERWAISSAAWDAIIEAKQRHQMEFLKALKEIVRSVTLVEAPRLFAASDYCKGRNIDTINFIDNRVRETFVSFLAKENIPVVRLLPQMIDSDGFMKPEYRSEKDGDQHHANAKIGIELAPEIIARVIGEQ
ncbi:hypothetical protein RE411_21965 [Agrobacterium pusense]|uniref:hypothetical protein n=1 Tax=Agrobacterium pusense TaxID=648995 RepID=UPI002867C7F4|nr:hypothetical protein [Agrobacterium pusense]WMW58605.1 hypothetical protein RE411_21965 [Agrobacterium pusense]